MIWHVLYWYYFLLNKSCLSLSHRWPVNSPHKWSVTRKMFPFDDVIIYTKYVMATTCRVPCLQAHYWMPGGPIMIWIELNLTWIINYIHYILWDKITYPFSTFSCAIIEVWELDTLFYPTDYWTEITWNWGWFVPIKKGPRGVTWLNWYVRIIVFVPSESDAYPTQLFKIMAVGGLVTQTTSASAGMVLDDLLLNILVSAPERLNYESILIKFITSRCT